MTNYFAKLKREVKNAQTIKTLDIILKHARRHYDEIIGNPYASLKIKRRITKAYHAIIRAVDKKSLSVEQ